MPRLLLVDDNPSIHKIAETLLATSDVQLVCCGSGAQAMTLVNQGDHFDVALLDTSMIGMDGWTLLQHLRDTASTAMMPVAMMAGVLDTVDPEKLRLAPIQGFLKKPVELRDLGDRVKRLLDTPVLPPPVPDLPQTVPAPHPEAFLTQPSLRVPDMLRSLPPEDDLLLLGPEDLYVEMPGDEAKDEPMDEPGLANALDLGEAAEFLDAPAGAEAMEALATSEFLDPAPAAAAPDPDGAPEPAVAVSEYEGFDGLDIQDLQDFQDLPEPPLAGQPAVEAEEPLPEDAEPLDLEELDLDSLRGLSLPSSALEPAQADPEAAMFPEAVPGEAAPPSALEEEAGYAMPDFELADTLPEAPEAHPEPTLAFTEDLPEFGSYQDHSLELEPVQEQSPAPASLGAESIDWSDDSDSLVGMALGGPEPSPVPFAAEADPADITVLQDAITLSDILDPPAPALEPAPVNTPAELPAPADAQTDDRTDDRTDAQTDPRIDAQTDAQADAWLTEVEDEPAEALPAPSPAPELAAQPAGGPDPLAGLLADPVLMDRLAKALVARMGDKVLREIAWEVIPELAERMQQKGTP